MKVVPREYFRNAVREPYRPVSSEKLEALRKQTLLVAAYACYEEDDPQQFTSFEMIRRTYEALLESTLPWTSRGVFIDQCGRNSDWRQRPVFSGMLDDGAFDLIVCKSLSHLHADPLEALKAVAILERNDISVYFEAEGAYSRNYRDLLGLIAGTGVEQSR